jgi:hypothetical protein
MASLDLCHVYKTSVESMVQDWPVNCYSHVEDTACVTEFQDA